MTTAWFHFQILHTLRDYTGLTTKCRPLLIGRAEYLKSRNLRQECKLICGRDWNRLRERK